MALRDFAARATPVALTAGIDNLVTTVVLPVGSTANLLDLTPPFIVAIDYGKPAEEICLCTAMDASSLTVIRGYDETTRKAHDSGAIVRHVASAIDYREANEHVNAAAPHSGHATTGALTGHEGATTSVHGIVDTAQLAVKNAVNILTVGNQEIRSNADANPALILRRFSATHTGNLLRFDDQLGAAVAAVAGAGEYRASAGSAGSPAFAFLSDPDTGPYRVGADDYGIATGGSRRLRITTSQLTLENLTILSASGLVATFSNYKRGAGSPEGSVTGSIGDEYQRTDGSTGTTKYVKESGSGTTGWKAVSAGASIKATYRGTITIPQLTNNATASITAVDMAKSQLRFLGATSNIATQGSPNMFVRIDLQNTTTIRVQTHGGVPGNGESITVSYELTEWQ